MGQKQDLNKFFGALLHPNFLTMLGLLQLATARFHSPPHHQEKIGIGPEEPPTTLLQRQVDRYPRLKAHTAGGQALPAGKSRGG